MSDSNKKTTPSSGIWSSLGGKFLRSPLTPVYRLIIQPLSLPFLPLILWLPLPPDFWTVLCGLAKFAAGLLLFFPDYRFLFVVLLAAGMLFDSFDGVVARARGQSSYRGAYLDRAVDRLGACWILSCYALYWFQNGPDFAFLPLIGLFVIDIWHETLRCWVALTGSLLQSDPPLPAWDTWLRRHGILPLYGQDSLFLILSAGLFWSPASAVKTALLLGSLSLVYQLWLHRRRANRSADGDLYWFHLLRLLFNRLAGLALLSSIWLIISTNLDYRLAPVFFLAWLDFLIFYFLANRLMSLSANLPSEESDRQNYLNMMKKRDQNFLTRFWP